MARSKITNRIDTCRCGCKGGDPWHARSFTRSVKGVRKVDEETREPTKASTVPYRVLREGRARFPWGTERVIEIQTGTYDQVWDGDEFIRLDWRDLTDAAGAPISAGWWIASNDTN